MKNYHKRNGSFIYDQSQSTILTRILEVVFKPQSAFWLYSILLESILPLNFFSNGLHLQALIEYMTKMRKIYDKKLDRVCGSFIDMLLHKSLPCLFTNLSIDPNNINSCQKSEMAYLMLDLLFLFGDPKTQTTLLNKHVLTVGQRLPLKLINVDPKVLQE